MSDGQGGSASTSFTWAVNNANGPPLATNPGDQTRAEGQVISTAVPAGDHNSNRPPGVTTPGNQTSAEGSAVALSIAASDPDSDALSFSATGLPPGLSVNATTGVISGTLPFDAAGAYSVTVSVSDGHGGTATSAFAWTITNANQLPVVTNPEDQMSVEGEAVSTSIVAVDPDGDALSFSATGLPLGLSLDATTGVISGTLPFDGAGRYTVTVSVFDGTGTASTTFGWTITRTQPLRGR